MKHSYRSRKIFHARERCHLETSSKRRKLCNRSFAIAYDQEASSESISNLPDKRINGDNSSSTVITHRGPCLTATFAITAPSFYAVLLSNFANVLQETRLPLLLRATKSLKILIVRF